MKYVMITNWHGHWDAMRNNRTLFTESMFRNQMSKAFLKEKTSTLFIKKNRDTKCVEKAWEGKTSDFRNASYKDRPAVEFTVGLDKEINCPKEYLGYSEGWYVEELSGKATPRKTSSIWSKIEQEYGTSKRLLGRKINFIKNDFTRKIVFRDIEQAYVLLEGGFYKPSLILAGGVIEELLRQYLIHNTIKLTSNRFEDLIKDCSNNRLLKGAVSSLSSSARQFRNIVHLEKEKSSRHSISKATAKLTVASIFTITNDFH